MVVTIQAPSSAAQKRAFSQCMIMGLEATVLEDNCIDLVVQQLWKAKHVSNLVDGEIVAVHDRVKI